MQTVIGLPPRADPNIPSPTKTPGAFCCAWLAVVQRKVQQVRTCGKHCLASFSGDLNPGPACVYTMLVASDIKKDAYSPDL